MSDHTDTSGDDHAATMGFERLVFFSDAVLAIAITLMALEIRLPEMGQDASEQQIVTAVQGLVPHIFVYVLSFLVIGTYWVLHHRLFRMIRRYDYRLIWLNVVFLMFVAFVPAATNALGSYSFSPTVTALYAVSLALVGLSEYVVWWYALRQKFVQHVSSAPRLDRYISARILTPPLVFLLSLLTIPFSPNVTELSWALMIPVFYALRFIFPREHAARRDFEQGVRSG